MPEQPPLKPDNTEPTAEQRLLFGTPENAVQEIAAFEDAFRSGDIPRLSRSLENNRLLEHMLITKGEDGRNVDLVRKSIDTMAAGLGESFSTLPDARKMEELLRNGGVPPMALVEYCASLYHLKDEGRLSRSTGALLQLPTDVLPVESRGLLHNIVASQQFRAGDPATALKWNTQGVTLLRENNASGANAQWIERKLRYGIIIDKKNHEDTPEKLLKLAEQARDIGDTVHVGRTYLDVGRTCRDLGRTEEAIHYYQQALSHMQKHGYTSSAMVASKELGAMLLSNGTEHMARRVIVNGIGIGERMKRLYMEELDELRELKEREMAVPAVCLVQLGNEDSILVETAGEDASGAPRFMLPTVDQLFKKPRGPKKDGEQKRGGEGHVRRTIGTLLNTLLYETNAEAALETPIQLSQRGTRMRFRGNRTENDFAYAMNIADDAGMTALREALAGLDKSHKMGFTIQSLAQLLEHKDRFDSRSQALIERLIARGEFSE